MILDKKMELEFKRSKEIDIKFIVNSKQLFDELKNKYINI